MHQVIEAMSARIYRHRRTGLGTESGTEHNIQQNSNSGCSRASSNHLSAFLRLTVSVRTKGRYIQLDTTDLTVRQTSILESATLLG